MEVGVVVVVVVGVEVGVVVVVVVGVAVGVVVVVWVVVVVVVVGVVVVVVVEVGVLVVVGGVGRVVDGREVVVGIVCEHSSPEWQFIDKRFGPSHSPWPARHSLLRILVPLPQVWLHTDQADQPLHCACESLLNVMDLVRLI